MSWATPQHIKVRYASASFLHGNVVIFNVRGNSYRLEAHVAYRNGIVTVRRTQSPEMMHEESGAADRQD